MGKQKRHKKNVHFGDPDRKGMSGIVCGVASDSNLKEKKSSRPRFSGWLRGKKTRKNIIPTS